MRAVRHYYGAHCNPVVCGRKFCTACGRWRHVVDFAVHTREPLELQSRCRACLRIEHDALLANPAAVAARRAYNRAWQRRRRREQGVPERGEWLAKWSKAPIILGRKHCTRCGRWRPVSDFGHHGAIMAAACLVCLRRVQRARVERNRQDPRWVEQLREYQRIWHEAKRREAGVTPRALSRMPPPDPRHNHSGLRRKVSTEPLLPHLNAWLLGWAAEHAHERADRGIRALADAATVPERRIYAILEGEQTRCHYAVADRLAVAMDLPLALVYNGAS